MRTDSFAGVNARLQCAYAQESTYVLSVNAGPPVCSGECALSNRHAVAGEMDTERFCFMECEPKVTPSRFVDDRKSCEPISEAAKRERDSNGDPIAPMNNVRLARKFLSNSPTQTVLATGFAAIATGATLSTSAPPPPSPETPAFKEWSSVTSVAAGQASKASKLAQEVEATAALASVEAKKVSELSQRAELSSAQVLEALHSAEAASQKAVAAEVQLRAIRDATAHVAHEAAMREMELALPSLMEASREKSGVEALSRAEVMQAKLAVLVPKAAEQASQPYIDVMEEKKWVAAEYEARVGELQRNAETEQLAAGTFGKQADAYMQVGNLDEAKQFLRQSRVSANRASYFSQQAREFDRHAKSIFASLPEDSKMAGRAAYFAEKMLIPDVQPPTDAAIILNGTDLASLIP